MMFARRKVSEAWKKLKVADVDRTIAGAEINVENSSIVTSYSIYSSKSRSSKNLATDVRSRLLKSLQNSLLKQNYFAIEHLC